MADVNRRSALLSNRRAFLGASLAASLAGGVAWAAPPAAKRNAVFLAAVGAQITSYQVDPQRALLEQAGTVSVPQPVQYAWRHPRLPLLYVAYADRQSLDKGVGIAILNLARNGTLSETFPPLVLAHRPIHLSTDHQGRTLFVAYNEPSSVTVHALDADGRPGAAVAQNASIDGGTYAHQVRVTPDDRTVVLVTRGNDPTPKKAEDPGALKVFRLADAQLTPLQSVAPHGGIGFGPRHLDFHPSQPWVYVCMERENEVQMFRLQDGRLADEPTFVKSTLADPGLRNPRQLASAVHVSPDGRFVYVGNRADAVADDGGKKVFVGGENSIAVFRIDARSGEPTLVQTISTRSFNPRTFGVDPTGRMLVAAAIRPMQVRNAGQIVTVPAAISSFRIGPEGLLEFVAKHDVATGSDFMFWSGMVEIDAAA